MKKTSTITGVAFKKYLVFFLTILSFTFCQSVLGHSVDSYSGTCASGPQYKVTAVVSNVNNTSNYRWQWKNSSNVWVCFVNGNNTINGNTYNVSGAVYNLTTSPGPIIFTNPTSGLQGLQIRMVISDGNNVNPCNLPANNTWTSTNPFTININGTPCAGASIGDRVWYDTDRDGIQDNGENGINGVTVKLRNSANTVIATDVTDASGNYLFTNLAAGNYTVEFPVSVYGYKMSPAYVGTNRSVDSDPSVTTGITPTITLTTGQVNLTIDAGYAPNCDCVASSSNLLINGSFENGTTGWSWSSSNGSLTTGNGYVACGVANGFNNQSSGTSRVWQDVALSPGQIATFSAYAGTHTPGIACSPKLSLIFLSSTNTVLLQSDITVTRDVDVNNSQLAFYTTTATAPAGTVKVRVQSSITCNTMKLDAFCLTATPALGSIGDRVWYDTDRDGIQDNGENGINGVTVKLRNAANAVIATDITDASGNYLFTGLAAGTYSVEFPATVYGYLLSPAYVGTNRDIDSDPSVTTGVTPSITLTTGQNIVNIDAGYAPDCACVNASSNLLVNGNFENGTTGWTWSSTNGSLTTGTGYVACGAANGFNNQSSGTSKVWQDVAVGAGATVTFKGYAGTHTPGINCSPTLSLIFLNAANTIMGQSNVTVTRDVDVNNSQLELYTITAVAPAGTTKVRVQSSITCNTMKMDAFCLTASATASIGDFVWEDLNRNGLQDANEPGIAGVTVTLGGTSSATTTTAADGSYHFNGLSAGTYNVTFTTPTIPGSFFLPSASNVGANDAIDSDPVGGAVSNIVLANGQVNNTIDAGFYRILNLSGNVWHDVNGMTDGLVNDTRGPNDAAIPTGLKMILVDANTSLVARTTLVLGNGTFSFPNIEPGTYILVLKVEGANITEPSPFASIPEGWRNTGEHLGLNPGADAVVNGKLTVTVSTVSVTNANFGINFGGDFPIN